jgi:hypothetical protein
MKVYRTGQDDLPHPTKIKDFRKKTTIKAVQMEKDFAVLTLEGMTYGKAGDWLAKGIRGELYPIAKEIFEETYEEVEYV